jgi:hypothetical protein
MAPPARRDSARPAGAAAMDFTGAGQRRIAVRCVWVHRNDAISDSDRRRHRNTRRFTVSAAPASEKTAASTKRPAPPSRVRRTAASVQRRNSRVTCPALLPRNERKSARSGAPKVGPVARRQSRSNCLITVQHLPRTLMGRSADRTKLGQVRRIQRLKPAATARRWMARGLRNLRQHSLGRAS